MDTYKSYDTTLEGLKETLNNYGVATIPNVLNEEELENNRNELWILLNKLTENMEIPISKDNPSSWKSYFNLIPKKGMLLQNFGIGHSQLAWNIRQNPKVASVFAHLWKTPKEELLTSFDGMSWQPAHEVTGKGHLVKSWFHCDQSFTNNNLKCYQGQVLLYDANVGDATLRVLEKSHKFHGDVANQFKITGKADWYKIDKDQEKYYIEKGCEDHSVLAKAGSLILWDSRTIHQGQVSLRNRPEQKNRCVVYVCMTPRSWALPKDVNKKIKAFEEQRATSHWPHKIKLFPKFPQLYGAPMPNVPQLDPPILTDLGMKLAGY